MNLKLLLLLLVSSAFLTACSHQHQKRPHTGPHYVEVREQNGRFQLFRNGQPYFIKGAGIYSHFNGLKESGGNSIRIYNVTADSALAILDKAHAAGLTVTVGLNIAYAGALDYSDEEAVTAQLERLKKDVLQIKDHPALLMWGLGNELNAKIKYKPILSHYQLWRAVNDIAKMVHDLDPNHPTTTMIPRFPKNGIRLISFLCDDIDILSINIFQPMKNLAEMIARQGWKGPFIVSEYGTGGHWNAPRTDWYAKSEPTSYEKARHFRLLYEKLILSSPGKCLGSYAFIWGQKQEYTTTWFSLFTETGQPTEIIDALQYVWTNKWPANRAPSIYALHLNQKQDTTNIYLQAGQKFTATLQTHDPENDSLQLNWEIHKDNLDIYFDSTIGQRKTEVVAKGKMPLPHIDIDNALLSTPVKRNRQRYKVRFTSPLQEGPYRLFMYVSDSQKKTATGNAAFYVYNK